MSIASSRKGSLLYRQISDGEIYLCVTQLYTWMHGADRIWNPWDRRPYTGGDQLFDTHRTMLRTGRGSDGQDSVIRVRKQSMCDVVYGDGLRLS